MVKKYEVGHVHLVDTAQYLVQHTSYELPALKKELGRAERELSELQRRQADFVGMAEASRARYATACAKKQLGECERDNIRAELRASLGQLRPMYDRVARLADDLDRFLAAHPAPGDEGRGYYPMPGPYGTISDY